MNLNKSCLIIFWNFFSVVQVFKIYNETSIFLKTVYILKTTVDRFKKIFNQLQTLILKFYLLKRLIFKMYKFKCY